MSTAKAQVEVKERPIIFSGPMVRAILEGRKTQTRRVLKFPKHTYEPTADWVKAVYQDGGGNWVAWSRDSLDLADFTKKAYPNGEGFPCPYGKDGDRLWVRETWRASNGTGTMFKADGPKGFLRHFPNDTTESFSLLKWRPSIYMPRALSRLALEITGIRVERLQDISQEDMAAEGFRAYNGNAPFRLREIAKDNFAAGWDSINGKRPGCSWSDNPWVWVIEFKKVEQPSILSDAEGAHQPES